MAKSYSVSIGRELLVASVKKRELLVTVGEDPHHPIPHPLPSPFKREWTFHQKEQLVSPFRSFHITWNIRELNA